MHRICLLIASLAAMALAGPAFSQDAYPSRPVRWIVPFPAGGPTDTLSRILTARLSDMWGQSVVVENKGGASGAIGTDSAAKALPDGYTLMLGTQSTNGSNQIFFPNLPYDPIKDFQPLTLLGTGSASNYFNGVTSLVAGDGSSEYTGGWRGDQRHGHGVLFQVCVEGAGWGRGQAKRREGFGWAGGGSEHKKDCTNI